jgi:hypothetical protein
VEEEILLFFLSAFVAEIIGTMAGFGFLHNALEKNDRMEFEGYP